MININDNIKVYEGRTITGTGAGVFDRLFNDYTEREIRLKEITLHL